MGENISVLAGDLHVLRRLRSGEQRVRLFVPHAGAMLGVAPITIQMDDNVPEWYGPIRDGETRFLPPNDLILSERISADGALAYLETDYQGGTGHECAALWRDGRLVFGLDTRVPEPVAPPPPLNFFDRLRGRVPMPPPLPPTPVSRALDALGGGLAEGWMRLRSNQHLAWQWIELAPDEPG